MSETHPCPEHAERITLDDEPGDWLDWRRGSGRTVEIFDIHVGNERRRTGKGRRLVQALLGRLTTGTEKPDGVTLVWATTRWGNTAAQEFYEALGFRIVGRLHYFYVEGHLARDKEHAIIFGLDV
jgi:ribosomal protein S18 acetylase RimI-like enzyme